MFYVDLNQKLWTFCSSFSTMMILSCVQLLLWLSGKCHRVLEKPKHAGWKNTKKNQNASCKPNIWYFQRVAAERKATSTQTHFQTPFKIITWLTDVLLFSKFCLHRNEDENTKRGGEVKSEMTTVIGGRMLSKYQPPEGTVEPRGDAYDRNAPPQPRAPLLT